MYDDHDRNESSFILFFSSSDISLFLVFSWSYLMWSLEAFHMSADGDYHFPLFSTKITVTSHRWDVGLCIRMWISWSHVSFWYWKTVDLEHIFKAIRFFVLYRFVCFYFVFFPLSPIPVIFQQLNTWRTECIGPGWNKSKSVFSEKNWKLNGTKNVGSKGISLYAFLHLNFEREKTRLTLTTLEWPRFGRKTFFRGGEESWFYVSDEEIERLPINHQSDQACRLWRSN